MGLALQGLDLFDELSVYFEEVLVLQPVPLPLQNYPVLLLLQLAPILLEPHLALSDSLVRLIAPAVEGLLQPMHLFVVKLCEGLLFSLQLLGLLLHHLLGEFVFVDDAAFKLPVVLLELLVLLPEGVDLALKEGDGLFALLLVGVVLLLEGSEALLLMLQLPLLRALPLFQALHLQLLLLLQLAIKLLVLSPKRLDLAHPIIVQDGTIDIDLFFCPLLQLLHLGLLKLLG